ALWSNPRKKIKRTILCKLRNTCRQAEFSRRKISIIRIKRARSYAKSQPNFTNQRLSEIPAKGPVDLVCQRQTRPTITHYYPYLSFSRKRESRWWRCARALPFGPNGPLHRLHPAEPEIPLELQAAQHV